MKSKILTIVIGIILLISLITLISAQEVSYCCEKTKSDAWCVNAPKEQCNANFQISPTACESTSYCKKGCCYDSDEGNCIPSVPEESCHASNGAWSKDANCATTPQCNLGCCVLGTEAAYVTLARCKKLSGFYGLLTDFKSDIQDELSCIALATSQDKGACVFESEFTKTCKFTTRAECNSIKENEKVTADSIKFYKDFLCTAEQLGTECGKSKETKCDAGKVYFIDTCGNLANIYDASKVNDRAYWTKIKTSGESCQGSAKTCGNCDYLGRGTICKQGSGATYGDYICTDVNCYDTSNGKDYKNGESWCYYDNKNNPNTDSVGSRHYRHICIMGEETIEACSDLRAQVCVENSIEGERGESFSQAGCAVNKWEYCILQNTTTDCLNRDKGDCIWIPTGDPKEILKSAKGMIDTENVLMNFLNIKGDERYVEGRCAPKISPGLMFWDESAKSTCVVGTQSCIVKFEKKLIGEKKCVENCWCLDEETALLANYICSSYGDCGAGINYVGKFVNKGYEIEVTKGKEAPKVEGGSASPSAQPVFGGETQQPFSQPAGTGSVIQGLIVKAYNQVVGE